MCLFYKDYKIICTDEGFLISVGQQLEEEVIIKQAKSIKEARKFIDRNLS